MPTRKMIIGMFACFSVVVFASQTLPQKQIADRTREIPNMNQQRNMTSEQINRE